MILKEKISQRKREANQSNAKSSTGPRDTKATRFNAVKHGILTKEALPLLGDGDEDNEVREELDKLRQDLAPVGGLEELLVDDLIQLYLRKRQLIRYLTGVTKAQSGPIIRSLEELANWTERENRELSDLDEKDPLAAQPGLWTRAFETAERRFEVCIEKLLGVEDFWDPSHHYSREQIQQVIEAACQSKNIAVEEFWKVVKEETQRDYAQGNPNPERRRLELEQKLRLAALPPYTVLDKLQRYETQLSRSISKTIHDLTRLQATRKGSRPPDP